MIKTDTANESWIVAGIGIQDVNFVPFRAPHLIYLPTISVDVHSEVEW